MRNFLLLLNFLSLSTLKDTQPPEISGVNSAIIKVSQSLTLEQLINSFLVLSDNIDTLTIDDVAILSHSTCQLDAPQVGTCTVYLQVQDDSGNLSAIFPLELTFVSDTTPEITGPEHIIVSNRLELTTAMLEQLLTYDRLNHDIEWIDSTLPSTPYPEGEYSSTLRITNQVGNRFYLRLSMEVIAAFPAVVATQHSEQWVVYLHPTTTLVPQDYEKLALQIGVSSELLMVQLEDYRLHPAEQKEYHFTFVTSNETSMTLRWRVDEDYPSEHQLSQPWWHLLWDVVQLAWNWIIRQFHRLIGWITQLLK